MSKIIKNSDGSVFFTTGNVMLAKKGVDSEVIEVKELDIEKARTDKKYVNDLVTRSTIKEKKHGT